MFTDLMSSRSSKEERLKLCDKISLKNWNEEWEPTKWKSKIFQPKNRPFN